MYGLWLRLDPGLSSGYHDRQVALAGMATKFQNRDSICPVEEGRHNRGLKGREFKQHGA
jgi:hypothetical protein